MTRHLYNILFSDRHVTPLWLRLADWLPSRALTFVGWHSPHPPRLAAAATASTSITRNRSCFTGRRTRTSRTPVHHVGLTVATRPRKVTPSTVSSQQPLREKPCRVNASEPGQEWTIPRSLVTAGTENSSGGCRALLFSANWRNMVSVFLFPPPPRV